jgi:hypothetical protein
MTHPLVYHYTGKVLPNYARTTLRKVSKNWSGPVIILNNTIKPIDVPGVTDEKFETWYDPEVFQNVAKDFGMDSDFRDGFWLHAFERFFILLQWMDRENIKRFLHAELDVVLFGGVEVLSRLDSLRGGLFLPRASTIQAGANWLYVNQRASLDALVEYFVAHAGQGYEMQLLGRFLKDMPDLAFSVPSHQFFEEADSSSRGVNELSLDQVRGVIDIHPIGTWLFGQDRRNIPKQPVFNRFYFDDVGSPIMNSLRFGFSWWSRFPTVRDIRNNSGTWPVFALHVHSKVMRRANSSMMLALHAWLANRNFRTIIIPQNTFKYAYSRLRLGVDLAYSAFRLGFFREWLGKNLLKILGKPD